MTECGKCGDCCEDIKLNVPQGTITAMLANPYIAGRGRRDMIFVQEYMILTGRVDGKFASHPRQIRDCLMFDPETNLCNAHEQRPLLCAGYPWYSGGPSKSQHLHARCTFNADVRTMLPIVSIT